MASLRKRVAQLEKQVRELTDPTEHSALSPEKAAAIARSAIVGDTDSKEDNWPPKTLEEFRDLVEKIIIHQMEEEKALVDHWIEGLDDKP